MSHNHHHHSMAMTTQSSMTMNHSMSKNHTMAHNHGQMNHHGSTDHYMQMWFVAGTEVTIVFKEWKVATVGELIGSMIALIILGVIYEGIKVGREILKRQAARRVIVKESYNLSNGDAKKSPEPTYVVSSPREMLLSRLHFLQTFLHMLQVFLGYFLMLAFMTYNAWVCVAVIIGAGLGYFAFGWKSVSIGDIGTHCL